MLFFEIFLDVTECGLFGDRTDRARTECLPCSEYDLGVLVRLGLVFSGKVQIDIRFLVSLESEERFERDIKSFFFKRCPADRTYLVRHIASGSSGISFNLFGIKITVMTGTAVVMRRQRIDLCDAGHRGNKR